MLSFGILKDRTAPYSRLDLSLSSRFEWDFITFTGATLIFFCIFYGLPKSLRSDWRKRRQRFCLLAECPDITCKEIKHTQDI